MQEQVTLTLPVTKKQVIIRGYVTGLVDQDVQKILVGANKTSYEAPMDEVNVDKPDLTSMPAGSKVVVNVDPTVQIDADNKLLELMLLAVDGNNGTNLLDKLLAFPKQDVDFVMAKVKELQAAGEVSSDPKE